jgi:hypothetical protein
MVADTFTAKNRERKRKWRATHPGLVEDDRPFIGVDGEGGTTISGTHDYFMLRFGEESITNPDGHLGSWACLDFLSRQSPRVIPVAFFFDYDVTMICKDLPEERIRHLLDRESRIPTRAHWGKGGRPWPVDVYGGEFQIDYLPRKFFKVRRLLGTQNDKKVYSPWITVNDVGTFFQCPFVEFLHRWNVGTLDQRSAIEVGKAYRNQFDAKDMPAIDRYNHLECRLLADGMEYFRDVCKRSGYVPRAWQGPGQIAEAVMKARGIPRSKDVKLLTDRRYSELLEFAAKSFYGGRPEITRLGPVNVPVEQWDINSAYPYAMMHLPCLEHGRWTRGTKYYRGGGQTAIAYGHFKAHEDSRATLFGFPVRRETGSIYYPREGWGWYWSMEIDAARHQTFEPEAVWTYERTCGCVPFHFIPDLYAMRKRLGKDALGLYLKLALNSLYGKLAQSIGSPQYANPIWASFITSFTRAQIQEMIHDGSGHKRGTCGSDVLMVATDAIFTTDARSYEPGSGLGELSCTKHPGGLLLIQPGLYFTGDGSKPKTRGVPRTAIGEREQEFLDAWQAMLKTGKEEDGTVWVPLTVFIGLRQAIHRNKPRLAGTWMEYREDGEANGKRIGFEWRTKREVMERPMMGWGPATTYPYVGGPDVVTVPYSREIGKWRDNMRIDLEDQPDWVTILGFEGGQ